MLRGLLWTSGFCGLHTHRRFKSQHRQALSQATLLSAQSLVWAPTRSGLNVGSMFSQTQRGLNAWAKQLQVQGRRAAAARLRVGCLVAAQGAWQVSKLEAGRVQRLSS